MKVKILYYEVMSYKGWSDNMICREWQKGRADIEFLREVMIRQEKARISVVSETEAVVLPWWVRIVAKMGLWSQYNLRER